MNDREMLLICYGAMKGNPELVGDPVLELLEQHVLKTKAPKCAKPCLPKSFDPRKVVPPTFNPPPRPITAPGSSA